MLSNRFFSFGKFCVGRNTCHNRIVNFLRKLVLLAFAAGLCHLAFQGTSLILFIGIVLINQNIGMLGKVITGNFWLTVQCFPITGML